MSDVNYMTYGENALRVFDTFGDNLDFWANNSVALGNVIGVFLILVLVFFLLALMFRYGKNLLP